MTEAKFQSEYNKWKAVNMRITCAEELKVAREERLKIRDIAPHQLANLKNAKHGFIQHKIPDLGEQNPFDSFSLCEVPAYLIVLFYVPRRPKNFYIIDIDSFLGFMDDFPHKKSLTEEDCAKISYRKETL
jgi:hypothetical protein